MFETDTLENVIKSSGVLSGTPSSSGWYTVKCMVCNDYKARGGFLFENGAVAYHCFNCGKTTAHTPSSKKFSKGMLDVLHSFGIDMSQARKTLFASFGTAEETPEEAQHRELYRQPHPIELPASFEFIAQSNPHHTTAIDYLDSRLIDYAKYGLMISLSAPASKWHERVIIPIYNRSNQVIFYQGRTYTNHSKRWESPRDPKANVLFGYHNLDDYSKDYVIVCEGTFDAMSVDGVALLGSEFSPFHIRVLNMSSKKKIIVPQRDARGYEMALQALEQGYFLSFPDIGSAQDINDATIQYGRLYTEQQILAKVAQTKYQAQLKLGLWCSI